MNFQNILHYINCHIYLLDLKEILSKIKKNQFFYLGQPLTEGFINSCFQAIYPLGVTPIFCIFSQSVFQGIEGIIFGNAPEIDKRIVRTLWQSSQSLVLSRQLSISTIGRFLERDIKVKHNIKCIDRLFGNKTLYEGRTIFYQKICRRFATNHPLILIDWSGLSYFGKYH